MDSISVDIDIHDKEGVETYYSVWIDQFGNKTEKKITVNYDIPSINITNISKNSDLETASVFAELSQDVDQWNVSFQRRRWNIWKTLKTKNIDRADIDIWVGEKTVVWGPYTVWKDIAMYDKSGEVMALMNPETAELEFQSWYQNSLDVKVFVQNSAVLQLYNTMTDSLVFSIALPMKQLIKLEAEWYTIKDLSNRNDMWMFNWWKVVYKDWVNLLFISPTWHLYSELGLEWWYSYDRELQAIVLTLYQLSDLQKTNPIVVWLKVEPFTVW